MQESKIIDLHNHILFGVDDGATTIDESISILKEMKEQNVSAVCFTPHYRHGMFSYIKDDVEANFLKLKEEASKIGIEAFLGCEYHVDTRIVEKLDAGRIHTLGDSQYVLCEFKYETPENYIFEQCKHLLRHGYLPVVAHIERYSAFIKNPNLAVDIKRQGGMIQVNADAVLGIDGFWSKHFVKKMISSRYVDIIASDTHDMKKRACHLSQAYDYVTKKYGPNISEKLFYTNPAIVLGID